MKIFSLTFFILFSVFVFSQEEYIIVNNDSITVDKFTSEYKNNIEAEGMDNAIDAYVNFTLLQQAAHKTQLDTVKKFHKAFMQSFQPMKDKYLTDYQIDDELKKGIWSRLQTDRKAEIYAIGIQNKFDHQEVTERVKLTNELHQHVCSNAIASKDVQSYFDNSLLRQLWIRPFTISAEIERVVYKTPVGKCSEIIPSENGNFFVKVLDERPSTGITYLEYIFNPDKESILSAVELLKKDSTWVYVKNKFNRSEGAIGFQDQSKFESDIPIEFNEAISKLKNGKYTEPIALNDGYYIVKLNARKKFDHYDVIQDWIIKKIKETDYALHYVKKVEKKALASVPIIEDKNALKEVINAMGNDFFKNEKELVFEGDKPIWSAKDKQFTQQQFIQQINISKKYYNERTNQRAFLDDILPKLKKQFALNTYIQDMRLYNPSIKRDAEILKKSMYVDYYLDKEIYEKAKTDTLGQKQYLAKHQQDFTYLKRYDLEMYQFYDDADGKKILEMLKNGISKTEILKQFQHKKKANGAFEVVVKRGKFNADRSEFAKDFNPNNKLQISTFGNDKVVIKVNEILPPRAKTYEEAGFELKRAYQKYYYKQMLEKLRQDATISIPTTL